MQKFFTAFAVVVLALVMVPDVASAKDMTGRFGIGGDVTAAGVSGVSARFQVAKNFGIQAVANFDQVSGTDESGNDDVDFTVRRIAVAIRGDIVVAFTRNANLSIFFGINIISESVDSDDDNDDNDVDASAFPFEAGLRAEYFFSNFFSVHTEVGIVVAFFDEENQGVAGANTGGALVEGSGTLFEIGATDVFGSAGFTFWFN